MIVLAVSYAFKYTHTLLALYSKSQMKLDKKDCWQMLNGGFTRPDV